MIPLKLQEPTFYSAVFTITVYVNIIVDIYFSESVLVIPKGFNEVWAMRDGAKKIIISGTGV